MKIEQKKHFEPVTITLETKDDYDSFFRIIEEVGNIPAHRLDYVATNDHGLITTLSNFATNNV